MRKMLLSIAPLILILVCLSVTVTEASKSEKLIAEINRLLHEKTHITTKEEPPEKPKSPNSDVNFTIPQLQGILKVLKQELGQEEEGEENDDDDDDDEDYEEVEDDDKKRGFYAKDGVPRWDMPIKYTFATPVPKTPFYTDQEKDIIREGISWWESNTCISFVEYPNSESIGNWPHLLIVKGTGCLTNVGPNGEIAQTVNLGPDCLTPGIAAHEIGHALGLIHEFARLDRDNYIRINYENIITNDWYSYSKQNGALDYGTGYDVTSIMHYGSLLPINEGQKKRIIEPLDQYQLTSMGQRTTLSFSDVKRINLHYNCVAWSCSRVKLQQPCQHGGYQDPKNCVICRCPFGISGQFCETLTAPSKGPISCGGVVNVAPCSTSMITSPGYPGKYAADSSCSWIVQTTAHGLIFGFESQPELPCSSGDTCLDYVEIRTNTSHLDAPGDRFCRCGKTAGRVAVVDGGQAFVYFRSTPAKFGGGDHVGFRLNVFATCGSNLASEFASECMISKTGYDYEGSASTADSGLECLKWGAQTAHPAISFPDDSLLEADNYCRNPSSESAPWCYTDVSHSKPDFCSTIPKCESLPADQYRKVTHHHPHPPFHPSLSSTTTTVPVIITAGGKSNVQKQATGKEKRPVKPSVTVADDCRKSARGSEYQGKLSVTRFGFTCQRWNQQFPHGHPYTKDSMFPDNSATEAANYCRNPDPSFTQGVWCFTTDNYTRWDICNVPRCPFDDDETTKTRRNINDEDNDDDVIYSDHSPIDRSYPRIEDLIDYLVNLFNLN